MRISSENSGAALREAEYTAALAWVNLVWVRRWSKPGGRRRRQAEQMLAAAMAALEAVKQPPQKRAA